jgi:uncharacterized protein
MEFDRLLFAPLALTFLLAALPGKAVEEVDKEWQVVVASAEKGDPFSQWAMGFRALADSDLPKAHEWFKKSAEQNFNHSQYMMYMLHANGLGTKKNYAEASAWMNKALLNRDEREILSLMPKEVTEALSRRTPESAGKRLEKLKKTAENGDALAQALLGFAYKSGVLIKADKTEQLKWMTKSAEQGLALAQLYLGTAYSDGNGIAPDLKTAQMWYRKAAAQGDPSACFLLGNMLYKTGAGDPKDFPEVFKVYQSAAETGLVHAQGMMSVMYGLGHGVKKDRKISFEWSLKAAEGGLGSAQFFAGEEYELGEVVPKDIKKALELIRKSAESGYAPAQGKLAYLLFSGRGTERNIEEATKWFEKAAQQGDARAQAFLGESLIAGDGVPIDAVRGLRLLVASADQLSRMGVAALKRVADTGLPKKAGEQFAAFQKTSEKGPADDQYLIFRFIAAATKQTPSTSDSIKKWLTLAAKQGHEEAQAECKARGIDWKAGDDTKK